MNSQAIKNIFVFQKQIISHEHYTQPSDINWLRKQIVEENLYWSREEMETLIGVYYPSEYITLEEKNFIGNIFIDEDSKKYTNKPKVRYKGTDFEVSKTYFDVDKGGNVFEIIVETQRIPDVNLDKWKLFFESFYKEHESILIKNQEYEKRKEIKQNEPYSLLKKFSIFKSKK